MTTDIRAEAAKAAEKRAKMMQRECGGREVSYSLSDYSDGYATGHAAGFERGARAFAEWCNSHTFPRGVNLSWESRIARFLASRPAPGTGLAETEGESEGT